MKENLNQSGDSPTVYLCIPTVKTIVDYVEPLFKEDLPGIIKSLDGNRINEYIANRLTEIDDQSAIKQLPNVSEKFVAPDVIELEQMLHSSFRIANSKITTGSTQLSYTNRLKNSLLFEILCCISGVKAHAYIPETIDIQQFILSACTFQPPEVNFSDKVWERVMVMLKRKSDSNTQKISLAELVSVINIHW